MPIIPLFDLDAIALVHLSFDERTGMDYTIIVRFISRDILGIYDQN
jgi:hypothetical protein